MKIIVLAIVLAHILCSYLKLRNNKIKKNNTEASAQTKLRIAMRAKDIIIKPIIVTILGLIPNLSG